MGKSKLLYVIGSLMIVLMLFLSSNAAYSDAPGVPQPGERVPARSAPAQKRPAPVRRPVKPRVAAPRHSAPDPCAVATNKLNEAIELIRQERYKKALPYILGALKLQPKNPDAWYWFGVWNDRTGNFSNAQKYFAKALELDPNYPALSRIVVYPDDPYGKIPLWDTVRPAAIEGIFPLKDMNVVAPGSPESLGERGSWPEMESWSEMPVYLPPDP